MDKSKYGPLLQNGTVRNDALGVVPLAECEAAERAGVIVPCGEGSQASWAYASACRDGLLLPSQRAVHYLQSRQAPLALAAPVEDELPWD